MRDFKVALIVAWGVVFWGFLYTGRWTEAVLCFTMIAESLDNLQLRYHNGR